MMGAVCGIVFLFAVPSPAPYLLASTFVSGLVFDLVMMIGSYVRSIRSVPRILVGAAVSGVAESIVALTIITALASIQFFGSKSFSVLAVAWSTDIILNIVLSSIGAILAIRFLSGQFKPTSNLHTSEQEKLGDRKDGGKKDQNGRGQNSLWIGFVSERVFRYCRLYVPSTIVRQQ